MTKKTNPTKGVEVSQAIQRVIAALDALALPYERIDIDPEFSDTATFCQEYGEPLTHTCNTILVVSKRGERRFCACVVSSDARLDVNHRVKNVFGVPRASFAKPEQMHELTGMEVGGVTPLALPPEVSLFVDAPIADLEWIILGAGGRAAKIRTSPEVLRRLGATFVPLSFPSD